MFSALGPAQPSVYIYRTYMYVCWLLVQWQLAGGDWSALCRCWCWRWWWWCGCWWWSVADVIWSAPDDDVADGSGMPVAADERPPPYELPPPPPPLDGADGAGGGESGEPSLSRTLARSFSFLRFIRRFWNQTLTCRTNNNNLFLIPGNLYYQK